MIDAFPRTCSICGKKVLELGHRLKGSYRLADPDDLTSEYTCEECYAERWDKGFEASMDYSDEMMLREKSELLALGRVDRRELAFVVSWYGMGDWHCLACERVRLERKQALARTDEERDAVVDTLAQPCPHCGVEGRLRYVP